MEVDKVRALKPHGILKPDQARESVRPDQYLPIVDIPLVANALFDFAVGVTRPVSPMFGDH